MCSHQTGQPCSICVLIKQGSHALYVFSSNRAAMLYMCSHQTGQPCSICVLIKQGSHALYVFSSKRAATCVLIKHVFSQHLCHLIFPYGYRSAIAAANSQDSALICHHLTLSKHWFVFQTAKELCCFMLSWSSMASGLRIEQPGNDEHVFITTSDIVSSVPIRYLMIMITTILSRTTEVTDMLCILVALEITIL